MQGCPGYTAPHSSTSSGGGGSSSGGCGFLWLSCVHHYVSTGANWLNNQANNLTGGIINGITDTANLVGTPFRSFAANLINSLPTGVSSRTFTPVHAVFLDPAPSR